MDFRQCVNFRLRLAFDNMTFYHGVFCEEAGAVSIGCTPLEATVMPRIAKFRKITYKFG
jgi:hypothetical protein